MSFSIFLVFLLFFFWRQENRNKTKLKSQLFGTKSERVRECVPNCWDCVGLDYTVNLRGRKSTQPVEYSTTILCKARFTCKEPRQLLAPQHFMMTSKYCKLHSLGQDSQYVRWNIKHETDEEVGEHIHESLDREKRRARLRKEKDTKLEKEK